MKIEGKERRKTRKMGQMKEREREEKGRRKERKVKGKRIKKKMAELWWWCGKRLW